MKRLQTYILLVASLFMVILASPAQAHLTPNSEVQMDFGQHEVVADIIIPQGEYAYATGNPTGNDSASLAKATAFLRRTLSVTTASGASWHIAVESIAFVQIAVPPDLHVIARLTPPPGASARAFRFHWRAIIGQIPSHFVVFVARSDFSAGKIDDERDILGALQGIRQTMTINRGQPSVASGFQAAVGLGMRHIAEGHDHLLFLIALLLPAPLLASGPRWRHPRSARSTLWHLAGIVSAFTIGHSVTLIGAAVFDWRLPAQPVEIMIALSILISAAHALRPLFPDREALVAGGFGLIHGLAFATIISHFGLGITEKALTILGFNIGIELVQIAVVLSVIPALLMLVRTPYYGIVRMTGGLLAMCAALGWLAERVLNQDVALARFFDAAFRFTPWLIVALTLWGLLAHYRLRNGARFNRAGP